MSKFKVGDKVRRTVAGLTPIGSIHTIRSLSESGHFFDVVENETLPNYARATPNHPHPFMVGCFELVEPANTELVELIRVANEGAQARFELQEKGYLSQVETLSLGGTWIRVGRQLSVQYRIKPIAKPKFPELYVGPLEPDGRYGQWRVTVSDDGKMVSVGCREFDRIRLCDALGNLVRGDNGYHRVGPLELQGNRTGIWTSAGTISWDDADRLLAALEAYQKQLEECK